MPKKGNVRATEDEPLPVQEPESLNDAGLRRPHPAKSEERGMGSSMLDMLGGDLKKLQSTTSQFSGPTFKPSEEEKTDAAIPLKLHISQQRSADIGQCQPSSNFEKCVSPIIAVEHEKSKTYETQFRSPTDREFKVNQAERVTAYVSPQSKEALRSGELSDGFEVTSPDTISLSIDDDEGYCSPQLSPGADVRQRQEVQNNRRSGLSPPASLAALAEFPSENALRSIGNRVQGRGRPNVYVQQQSLKELEKQKQATAKSLRELEKQKQAAAKSEAALAEANAANVRHQKRAVELEAELERNQEAAKEREASLRAANKQTHMMVQKQLKALKDRQKKLQQATVVKSGKSTVQLKALLQEKEGWAAKLKARDLQVQELEAKVLEMSEQEMSAVGFEEMKRLGAENAELLEMLIASKANQKPSSSSSPEVSPESVILATKIAVKTRDTRLSDQSKAFDSLLESKLEEITKLEVERDTLLKRLEGSEDSQSVTATTGAEDSKVMEAAVVKAALAKAARELASAEAEAKAASVRAEAEAARATQLEADLKAAEANIEVTGANLRVAESKVPSEGVSALVSKMKKRSVDMQTALGDAQESLERSQKEAGELRAQLHTAQEKEKGNSNNDNDDTSDARPKKGKGNVRATEGEKGDRDREQELEAELARVKSSYAEAKLLISQTSERLRGADAATKARVAETAAAHEAELTKAQTRVTELEQEMVTRHLNAGAQQNESKSESKGVDIDTAVEAERKAGAAREESLRDAVKEAELNLKRVRLEKEQAALKMQQLEVSYREVQQLVGKSEQAEAGVAEKRRGAEVSSLRERLAESEKRCEETMAEQMESETAKAVMAAEKTSLQVQLDALRQRTERESQADTGADAKDPSSDVDVRLVELQSSFTALQGELRLRNTDLARTNVIYSRVKQDGAVCKERLKEATDKLREAQSTAAGAEEEMTRLKERAKKAEDAKKSSEVQMKEIMKSKQEVFESVEGFQKDRDTAVQELAVVKRRVQDLERVEQQLAECRIKLDSAESMGVALRKQQTEQNEGDSEEVAALHADLKKKTAYVAKMEMALKQATKVLKERATASCTKAPQIDIPRERQSAASMRDWDPEANLESMDLPPRGEACTPRHVPRHSSASNDRSTPIISLQSGGGHRDFNERAHASSSREFSGASREFNERHSSSARKERNHGIPSGTSDMGRNAFMMSDAVSNTRSGASTPVRGSSSSSADATSRYLSQATRMAYSSNNTHSSPSTYGSSSSRPVRHSSTYGTSSAIGASSSSRYSSGRRSGASSSFSTPSYSSSYRSSSSSSLGGRRRW